MTINESQISPGNNPKILRGIIAVVFGLLLAWIMGIYIWIGDSGEISDAQEEQGFTESVESLNSEERQKLEAFVIKRENEKLASNHGFSTTSKTVDTPALKKREHVDSVQVVRLPTWSLVIDSNDWIEANILKNLNENTENLSSGRHKLMIESSSAFFFKLDGKIGLSDGDNPILINYTQDFFLMGTKKGLASVNFRFVAPSS